MDRLSPTPSCTDSGFDSTEHPTPERDIKPIEYSSSRVILEYFPPTPSDSNSSVDREICDNILQSEVKNEVEEQEEERYEKNEQQSQISERCDTQNTEIVPVEKENETFCEKEEDMESDYEDGALVIDETVYEEEESEGRESVVNREDAEKEQQAESMEIEETPDCSQQYKSSDVFSIWDSLAGPSKECHLIQTHNDSTHVSPSKRSRSARRRFGNVHKSEGSRPQTVICEWNNCMQTENCLNALYDHVMKDHIRLLAECCTAPSTSESQNFCKESSCSSDGLDSEGRSMGTPSTVSDNLDEKEEEREDAEKEKKSTFLGCQWGNCEMELTRGSDERKYQWLEEHYRTRHAKGSQPFMCIIDGCTDRFSTTRQMEEHVRGAHIRVQEPKTVRKVIQKKMVDQKRPIYPRLSHPFYDVFWQCEILKKLREASALQYDCKVEMKCEKTCSGSKWRKSRPLRRMVITEVEEEEEEEEEYNEPILRFNVEHENSLTLDDLFPNQPNSESSHSMETS